MNLFSMRNKRLNKKLLITSALGIIFVCSTGTLLHFVYEWTKENTIVGLFAPVNESTWEHMKLLYFPMLIFFIGEYAFLFRQYPQLLRADFIAILTGTLLIPILFYTYTGLLGYHTLILDIFTFIASTIFAFWVRYRILLSLLRKKHTFFYFICVLVLGVCFLIFSYYPPDIALFVCFT